MWPGWSWDKMTAQGLEPNERLCSMLFADLAKSGSQLGLRRAEEMMAEMKRKGMNTSVVTWTSLISGYFRGGWDQDAWDAVDRMKRAGLPLNRVGYNIILHEGGRGKEWVMRLFRRMIKEGITPVGRYVFDPPSADGQGSKMGGSGRGIGRDATLEVQARERGISESSQASTC